MSVGVIHPLVPTSPTSSPTSYHSGWTRTTDPSCLFIPAGHQGTRFSSEAYDDMFHHLLYLRWNEKGRTAGAVLTGQPGIGVPL